MLIIGGPCTPTEMPAFECSKQNKETRKQYQQSIHHKQIANHSTTNNLLVENQMNSILSASLNEQCSDLVPLWGGMLLSRQQKQIGSGHIFSRKDTWPDGFLAKEREDLIKLSCDGFRFSQELLCNDSLEMIKEDTQVLGMFMTWFRFSVALWLLWFSIIPFSKTKYKINFTQEEHFLLNKTWVFSELNL